MRALLVGVDDRMAKSGRGRPSPTDQPLVKELTAETRTPAPVRETARTFKPREDFP